MKKQHERRDFLKQLSAISIGGATFSALPFSAEAHREEKPQETQNQNFTINLLQTTDVHCQLHAHDELFWENGKAVFRKAGGYAHMATYLNEFRKKNPYTFLVDTGDMFQGSELSVKTKGKALVPILNQLNYDLYLPGNWEVVYYKKTMQQLLGSLNAPKVCTNMYHDLGDGKKGELIFQPYHIWHVNGIKIGFIGYTDPLVPIRQSPNYSKGIIYTQPEENIAYYVDVLRNQEQCHFVILLSHLGLSQQIHLANLPVCEGVDYIFGGDTHERVRTPIVCKYAKVVEPGAFGSFVGKLELTVQNGKIVKDEYELVEISSTRYKPDKAMEALIAENEHPFLEDLQTIIGYSTLPLYRYFVIENTIDTMILDALYWKLQKEYNVDVVLSNGFRFCSPRATPDKTGNIPINSAFLYEMLPVDSTVRVAQATGRQISEWLEKELNNVFAKNAAERFGGWVVKFKGMKITFNAHGEKGQRVQSVLINNEPLNPDKTYTLCACERDGDPEDVLCRMKGVKNMKNTPFTLHMVMKDYLKANSPVTPKPAVSAKALDVPQDLLTQVRGVDYQFQ
ncbi:bifunctional metallophosphatase/5'-nucleotidase [Rhodoflexus caldus]|uniref:bifunctional metallophosphatase/5'-nucleotidase n=1 Tax=Rhodoflexus caldus TaxID=2891236 RepID=UPI00202A4ECE|nr:bifunctional metallophosphatase/5'-nucleotidase [Rhodoflexus caldus]